RGQILSWRARGALRRAGAEVMVGQKEGRIAELLYPATHFAPLACVGGVRRLHGKAKSRPVHAVSVSPLRGKVHTLYIFVLMSRTIALSPSLGAELVDYGDPDDLLDDAVISQCREALQWRGVLLIRGAHFDDDAQLAFSRKFGGEGGTPGGKE